MTGGSAAHTGFAFQDKVAAILAVHVLADSPIEFLGLPVGVTPSGISLETTASVDDILVPTSVDGQCFVNVKSTVTNSRRADSPLALAVDQFVKLWIARRSSDSSEGPGRPLDPERDRMVLIVGPGRSSSFARDFTKILSRIAVRRSLGPSDEIVRTKAECRVLETVLGHVRTSSFDHSGEEFTDIETAQLLAMVRTVLLDPDGMDKTNCVALLRHTVAGSLKEAERAWSQILDECRRLSDLGTGTDKSGLRERLRESGVQLIGAPDFKADILRLRRATQDELQGLEHLARLEVPTSTGRKRVEIERPVTRVLIEHATSESMLVTGAPGSGKSGSIYSAARQLISDGHPVVVIAADRHHVASWNDLHIDLRLENGLIDVLQNWRGPQHGVVFIDALDATRGGPSDIVFRELIQRVIQNTPNWSVVASIRAFDLRFGIEYRRLFPGSPVDNGYSNLEFDQIRHLSIPKLTAVELEQVWNYSLAMKRAFCDGTEGLREILHSPFNLFLLSEVLSKGSCDLTLISTQVELLHLYWSYRVTGSDHQYIARERVLKAALNAMLEEHRFSIAVDVVPNALDAALDRLLSEGVLLPLGGLQDEVRSISFTHHVLFDYALSRLILQNGTAPDLASRLASSEEDALMMAPATIMAFQILWDDERPQRSGFWSKALELAGSKEAGAFCRMLPARVAAGLVRSIEDFQRIINCLAKDNDCDREAASFLARHCIGALTTSALARRSELTILGPWPRIAEGLTCVAIEDARWMLKPLISHWMESALDLNVDDKRRIGTAARRMLNYSVGETYDESVVGVAIQGIARTLEAAPEESLASLTPLLHGDRVVERGHYELPRLIREFDYLLTHVTHTSHLVGDIYRAAFCSRLPAAEEVTSITGSHILNLTSTKAQDFGFSRYRLVEEFPRFFKASPGSATDALVDLAACAIEENLESDEPVETIVVSGKDARFLQDRSYGMRWDPIAREGLPLDQFECGLVALVDDDRLEDVDEVLSVVAQRNRLACVWAAILRAGALRPDTFGARLLDLATSKPVLNAIDTSEAARHLLCVLHPLLDDAKRQTIEEVALGLDEWAREAVLKRLLDEEMVSGRARSQRRDLVLREESSPMAPSSEFQIGSWSGDDSSSMSEEGVLLPEDDDWWLREEGVDLTNEENARLKRLTSAVEQIEQGCEEGSSGLNSIQQGWQQVVDLKAALESRGNIPMALRMSGWNALAAVAAKVTLSARTPDDLGQFPGLFEIVLGSLTPGFWPQAERSPNDERQFAEFGGWGSPAPRVEGARAIMGLCRVVPTFEPRLDALVGPLAKDPSPAVRMQILSLAATLRGSNESLMQEILEVGFYREDNERVLSCLLARIDPVLNDSPEWFTERLKVLEERSFRYRRKDSTEGCLEHVVRLLIRLWLVFDVDSAGLRVKAWTADPIAHDAKVRHALYSLRTAIIHGDVENPDPVSQRIRAGAIEFFDGVTQRLTSTLSSLPKDPERPKAEDEEVAIKAFAILDLAAAEVYFGSGAHDAPGPESDGSSDNWPSKSVRTRFLREMETTLAVLATVPHPSVTHRLLETLETFIADRPKLVFRMVTDALLQGGPSGGYQFERMGVDLFVRIVRRYLADYRGVLTSEPGFQQRLINALNAFTEAGWPDALRLVYDLPEELR